MGPSAIGRHHPRLSEIRKALRRGGLTPDGLLPIEGPHLLEEARRSGLEIAEVFSCEAPEILLPADGRFAGKRYVLSEAVLRSVSATEEPHGTLALVRPRDFVLEDLLRADAPETTLLVVLCGLQDPGNAGTILRAAEAFGASGCIATGGTTGRYNPKLVRASAGSLFRLPHVWNVGLAAIAERLAGAGVRMVATCSANGRGVSAPEAEDWTRPVAVLIGNEGAGLGDDEVALCDAVVRIPHSARVESLNVATAAAVILYEARRQREAGA